MEMKTDLKAILAAVPDWVDWPSAARWIKQGQDILKSSPAIHTFTFANWKDFCEPAVYSSFGLYPQANWRKFALALFLADLVSYLVPVDQVNFERLLFVFHAYPAGFRIGWVQTASGEWWPAGYTALYPMLETSFQIFENSPEKLRDRMVVPDIRAQPLGAFLYLFNYSVAPDYKKTDFSRALIKSYVADVQGAQPRGLCTVCVSNEGAQVARKFGMSQRGILTLDGDAEDVFTLRNY